VKAVYGVQGTPAFPVSMTQSITEFDALVSNTSAGQVSPERTLYTVKNLYLLATTESKARLFSGFQSAPFVEPATHLIYLRERWLASHDGQFLTPDPMGYQDSSNLYAFAGGDPVNGTDPTGLRNPN